MLTSFHTDYLSVIVRGAKEVRFFSFPAYKTLTAKPLGFFLFTGICFYCAHIVQQNARLFQEVAHSRALPLLETLFNLSLDCLFSMCANSNLSFFKGSYV
jgi:hypothetical protein